MTVVVDMRWKDLLYRCDDCGVVVSKRVTPELLEEWTVDHEPGGPHHWCADCREAAS